MLKNNVIINIINIKIFNMLELNIYILNLINKKNNSQ